MFLKMEKPFVIHEATDTVMLSFSQVRNLKHHQLLQEAVRELLRMNYYAIILSNMEY